MFQSVYFVNATYVVHIKSHLWWERDRRKHFLWIFLTLNTFLYHLMYNFMILNSYPIMIVLKHVALAHSSMSPFTFGLWFIFKVGWRISPTFNCSLSFLTCSFGVYNVAYIEADEDDAVVEEWETVDVLVPVNA